MQLKLVRSDCPINKNQVNSRWHHTLTSFRNRISPFYWTTHSKETNGLYCTVFWP